MTQRVKSYFNRILGIKLRYRMLLVYMIGGALPIILIGMYLVHGMSRILIDQAKNVEVSEMEMVRRQAEEIMSTVSTVTKYFYFDEQLEEISLKRYTDYQDMVRDYRDFTSFLDYGRYYNSTIAWMNLYMKNPTIVENSRFIQVTGEMEEEDWYKSVSRKNGGALWHFHPVPAADYNALSMLRMLKTRKGEEVGVLAVYIRPERFHTP